MKEFNLEAAKAGEPIRHREDDAEISFVGWDSYQGKIVIKDEETGYIHVYPEDGSCPMECDPGCSFDIVMAGKKKVQRWVVPEGGLWKDTLWESLEKAKKDYPFELYREVEE